MSDLTSKTTRMCGACARDFEIPEGHIGRPPTKCPSCRGESSETKPKRAKKTPRASAASSSRPRSTKPKAKAAVNGGVAGAIAELQREVEILDERREQLTAAIESLEALN